MRIHWRHPKRCNDRCFLSKKTFFYTTLNNFISLKILNVRVWENEDCFLSCCNCGHRLITDPRSADKLQLTASNDAACDDPRDTFRFQSYYLFSSVCWKQVLFNVGNVLRSRKAASRPILVSEPVLLNQSNYQFFEKIKYRMDKW